MSELVQAILRFLRSLKLWVIVSPWEQAVRVRRGKRVTVLNAGIHLKIPVLDIVCVQSTRLRFTACDRQTVTTLDGKTVTFAASIGYEIANLEMLYRSTHHAEDTIRQTARGTLANYFSMTRADTLNLGDCANDVQLLLLPELSEFGLLVKGLEITDLAMVRTYRLIGDYAAAYQTGSVLDTEAKDQAVK